MQVKPRRIQFSPDENKLAMAAADGRVCIPNSDGAFEAIQGSQVPLFEV
jgi:hypothetical protein